MRNKPPPTPYALTVCRNQQMATAITKRAEKTSLGAKLYPRTRPGPCESPSSLVLPGSRVNHGSSFAESRVTRRSSLYFLSLRLSRESQFPS